MAISYGAGNDAVELIANPIHELRDGWDLQTYIDSHADTDTGSDTHTDIYIDTDAFRLLFRFQFRSPFRFSIIFMSIFIFVLVSVFLFVFRFLFLFVFTIVLLFAFMLLLPSSSLPFFVPPFRFHFRFRPVFPKVVRLRVPKQSRRELQGPGIVYFPLEETRLSFLTLF